MPCYLRKDEMMRGVPLKDWFWVAAVEYKDYPDSHVTCSSLIAPDFLSAVAYIQNYVKDRWPYEIISLEQIKIAQTPDV